MKNRFDIYKNRNMLHWRIFAIAFVIILILISFSNCTTERRCAQKFPQEIITKDCTIYKDVIKEILIHDTIFIIGDTVYNSDTVFTHNNIANSDPVFAYTDYAHAKAQVINSSLILNLIQNDTAIARLLKENVTIKEKEVFVTDTLIKKVWLVHWYDKAARVIAGIFIIAICILIAIRVIKTYIKPF